MSGLCTCSLRSLPLTGCNAEQQHEAQEAHIDRSGRVPEPLTCLTFPATGWRSVTRSTLSVHPDHARRHHPFSTAQHPHSPLFPLSHPPPPFTVYPNLSLVLLLPLLSLITSPLSQPPILHRQRYLNTPAPHRPSFEAPSSPSPLLPRSTMPSLFALAALLPALAAAVPCVQFDSNGGLYAFGGAEDVSLGTSSSWSCE